jgi:hypothetical protein
MLYGDLGLSKKFAKHYSTKITRDEFKYLYEEWDILKEEIEYWVHITTSLPYSFYKKKEIVCRFHFYSHNIFI